jgi:hypothetical protein
VGNWAYFSRSLIIKARKITGLSEQETKNLIEMCDKYLASFKNHETLSAIPGFRKNSLQPYAFIARQDDPKGLFQVLKKGKSRYFLSLTSQPIRVYREINKQKLIEVQTFDYRVESYHDGSMCVVDRDGKIQFINKFDRFIEIDIN